MELGKYIDGRAVRYDEGTGTFAVGDAPVSVDDIRRYSDAGQIAWATADIAAWFRTSFPPQKKGGGATIVIVVAALFFGLIFLCGILAAIAVPVFSSAKVSAEKKACWANERTMEGAAQGYRADKEVLPGTIEELVPTYLASRPVCPAGGTYTWDPASGKADCSTHGQHPAP